MLTESSMASASVSSRSSCMALAAMSLLSWDSSARMGARPPSLSSSGYNSGELAMTWSLQGWCSKDTLLIFGTWAGGS